MTKGYSKKITTPFDRSSATAIPRNIPRGQMTVHVTALLITTIGVFVNILMPSQDTECACGDVRGGEGCSCCEASTAEQRPALGLSETEVEG